MRISERLQAVQPSATMVITQQAREMKSNGHDVIGLSVGEPDFDTPEHIRQAAYDAIQAGHTRYTAVDGVPELKAAICEKFLRDNALSFDPSEITVAPGGKAILFNALVATLDPGDEVIIPAPCWVSYPEMVRLLGGQPVIVSCPLDDAYKLNPETLEKAITPKTRWLMLNSPSNPTGMVYTADELKALGEVLLHHPQVMVLCDDIYEVLCYDGTPFVTMAEAVPELKNRVLTMNGVSKAYAMTGWRIGYAGGPAWLIRAMAKVMTQSTSNACSISQQATLSALSGDQAFLHDWRQVFQKRRDYVLGRLQAIRGLSCVKPDGAFYLFVQCQDWLDRMGRSKTALQSDVDLAQRLLQQAEVAIVPGSAFHSPGHFRVSFATDIETLQRACDRIETFSWNIT